MIPVHTKDIPSSFFYRLGQMVQRVRAKGANVTGPDFLAVWALESGIQPNLQNRQGYPYYGLNQMGVSQLKAAGYGGTPQDYLRLSLTQQLPFVEKYYENASQGNWRLWKSPGVLYLVNFLPALVPKGAADPDYPLAERDNDKRGWYKANRYLDVNNNGVITLRDLDAAVDRHRYSARYKEAVARYQLESEFPDAVDTVGKPSPSAESPVPLQGESDMESGISSSERDVDLAAVVLARHIALYGIERKTYELKAYVTQFQTKHGKLVLDGVYGPKTAQALADQLQHIAKGL